MSEDKDWIAKQIEEAQSTHGTGTAAIAPILKDLLAGPLLSRRLTHTELKEIARQLISAMAVPSEARKYANKQD